MNTFLELIAREFRHFFSNSIAVLILFGAPLAYGILFGLVYQQGTAENLPVAVVDPNPTSLTHTLIDAIDDNKTVSVVRVVPEAGMLRDDMITGAVLGIVHIPEGFERDINQQRYPAVHIDLNAANIVNANFALKGLRTSIESVNAGIEIEALKKQGVPGSVASQQFQPFAVSSTFQFNPSVNYLYFLFPGLLATILQQVMLLALALSFSKEYDDKTMSHLVSKSGNALMLFVTKSLPYLLMGSIIWLLCLHGMMYYFRVPVPAESLMLIYLFSAMFIISVTAIGILVSAALPSQLKSMEVLMVIATPAFIISGFTWPMSQMPDVVVWVASVIPLTHFLEAFRNILMAGAEWHHVVPQFKALLWLTVIPVIAALGVIYLRITKTVDLMESLKKKPETAEA
ncbi:MAG: ABC transporter permease [Balneolia bacterium]|nr:ABC transporter permease [Balneolia bacterium]